MNEQPKATLQGLDNIASLAPPGEKQRLYDAFVDLGFFVYPLGRQSGPGPDGNLTPLGTGSRAVNLPDGGYFEFMGVEEPDKPDLGYGAAITEKGTHLAKVQIRLPDAAAEVEILRGMGHEVAGPRYFERHFTGPDGKPAIAQFRLFRYPPELTDGLQVTGAEHLKPEILWQPEWMNHANGARRLIGAIIAVSDPHDSASRWGAMFRCRPEREAEGARLPFPDGTYLLFRPSNGASNHIVSPVFELPAGKNESGANTHLSPANSPVDLDGFEVRAVST